MAKPIPDDTRGIIDPVEMMRFVDFARSPAGDALDGLIEWFWSVAWELPGDRVHDQQVLNHPAGNISVGTLDDAGVQLDPAEGRVYGVMTKMSHRRLTATGWTVAARTSVGGLGVLLDAPAKAVVDAELCLDGALPGLDGQRLIARVRAARSNEQRVDCLREELNRLVSCREPSLIAEAREVTRRHLGTAPRPTSHKPLAPAPEDVAGRSHRRDASVCDPGFDEARLNGAGWKLAHFEGESSWSVRPLVDRWSRDRAAEQRRRCRPCDGLGLQQRDR